MTPRPEYPRPHFDRSHSWLCLNGAWEFSIGDEDPDALAWDRRITVPFAWQTEASGIGVHWLSLGWYRRHFTVPPAWVGQRVVLHFGAVHHEATVWVNGVEVIRHRGGYVPFEVDVTDALAAGEQELVVRVYAPQDQRDIAHGKQRSVPRDDYDGVTFTPTSGIWQSVWLDARPRTHLCQLELRAGDGLDRIDARVHARGPHAAGATVTLRVTGQADPVALTLDTDGRGSVAIPIDDPRLWSPADPHLYHVEASLRTADGTDRVRGYTGLRRVEAVGEELFLNGERLYLRGVLDQGYWPRTGLTAPDDDALVADLRLAAEAGYNLVRKHLKLEDPRFVHHADRLGMLVWAEPASTGRFTPASVDAFAAQIRPMVERDGNSPAVVIWGLYNEEWGLDWDIPGDPAKQAAVADAYDLLKRLDPSRPAVDNSGWTHVRTDLLDWHYYDESAASWGRTLTELVEGDRTDFPVKLGPDFLVRKALVVPGQPLRGIPNLNSEYGTGFTSVERGWHLRWQTQELRRHDRLSGYVYTELYDIEHEMAGLLTYDRRAKDLGGTFPANVNADTVLVLDVVPVAPGRDLLTATGEVDIAVRLSHHGTGPVQGQLRIAWTDTYAPPPAAGTGWQEIEGPILAAKPFLLGEPVRLHTTLPAGRVNGRLHIAFDGTGAQARTAVDVDTRVDRHVGDDPAAAPV